MRSPDRAPYGKHPSAGLLYGLIYAVAAINTLLWLLASRLTRKPATITAAVAVVLTASLAAVLLTSTEYGAHSYPPVWGTLAPLPAVTGALEIALLVRRKGQVDSGS